MEQHPIPQQISSYQFKLVGDMTLKQFFQVAGGALVGLLFYSTGLHGLIKWPLILISVGLGAAMAFLPFEERPLEKWIIAFFRSIYSPTSYIWKKSDKPLVYFTENATVPVTGQVQVDENYLKSIPQSSTHQKLETAEKSFLSKLTSLLPTQAPSTAVKPVVPATPKLTTNNLQPTTKQSLTVPFQQPVSVPRLIVEEKPKLVDTTSQIKAEEVKGVQHTQKGVSTKMAEFSIDAAPPSPPTIANTITGQIIDEKRKIIAGAIMEIRDADGRPARALKSNMAGHFIIVTPLVSGKYEIKTEKEGYKFEPVSFNAVGEIIPPIAIKGTKLEGSEDASR